MITRLFTLFAFSLLLTGCGYGIKTDDEGGVEMKMPGQSMKVDKEGVEIDQGVQKLRVGKDEVDIQQPGQRIRVAGGDVDIDQGVQKLHLGKDGVDFQQPNQHLQVSKDAAEAEQTPLTVDQSTTAVPEPNPFTETGRTEPVKEASKAIKKVESPGVATTDEQHLGEENPATQEAKAVASKETEINSVDVAPPPAKEATHPRPVARGPTPAAGREAAPRVAAAPVPVDVPRSPLRLRLTAPLDQKDFSGQRVVQLNLAGRDLRGADFSNATIIQTDFGGCDLRGVNFRGAEITQCSFEDAKLHNANFEQVTLKQGWFSGADFSGASFRGAKLTQVDLRASHLTMASFAEAEERSVQKP